jgi:hypothetical protein
MSTGAFGAVVTRTSMPESLTFWADSGWSIRTVGEIVEGSSVASGNASSDVSGADSVVSSSAGWVDSADSACSPAPSPDSVWSVASSAEVSGAVSDASVVAASVGVGVAVDAAGSADSGPTWARAGVATSAPTARTTAGASARERSEGFFTAVPYCSRARQGGACAGQGL